VFVYDSHLVTLKAPLKNFPAAKPMQVPERSGAVFGTKIKRRAAQAVEKLVLILKFQVDSALDLSERTNS